MKSIIYEASVLPPLDREGLSRVFETAQKLVIVCIQVQYIYGAHGEIPIDIKSGIQVSVARFQRQCLCVTASSAHILRIGGISRNARPITEIAVDSNASFSAFVFLWEGCERIVRACCSAIGIRGFDPVVVSGVGRKVCQGYTVICDLS